MGDRFALLYLAIQLLSDMSFFGVELNAQVNKQVFEIRLQLSRNKHSPNVRTIYRAFANYDPEISGFIQLQLFEQALNENALFFKKYEIQIFQKAFGTKGQINWFQFLRIVSESMGPLRRRLVEDIFDNMDSKKEGKLEVNQLLSHLNISQFEGFRFGKKSQEQVKQQFISLFSAPEGFVTKEEFLAYYDNLNINFTHNDVFFRYVSSQWHYTHEKLNAVKEEAVRIAIKNLRFRLIQKSQGTKDQLLVRKLFNEYDKKGNLYLSPYDTNQMMLSLKVGVDAQTAEAVHERLDKNSSGYIQFEQFKKFLYYDPYPL